MKLGTLLESAQEHAQEAFHDKARGRVGAAALHLGVMLEHLAKAYLVSLHPACIVDGKTFDNLLAVCGHAKHIKTGHRVRTITLEQALTRFAQIDPSFQITPELKLVINARDGSAHAGERPEDLDAIFQAAMKATQKLLKALDHDEATFWGGYADTVSAILTHHTDAVRADVHLRIAEAARSYDERFGAMTPEQLTAVQAAAAMMTSTADADSSAKADCPACYNVGLLTGHTDMHWEPDYDYDADTGRDEFTGVYGQLILIPAEFRCLFCQLLLDSDAELAVVGLDAPRELRNATADDYRDFYNEEW
ncbi:hypothetical protein [Catellatospora sp. NPDC049133]|uniref:hypothetical protein n=1 Tax=Catellatospora sp. NPDC049133 TaxID=3155499 RepID=UPI0033C15972